MEQRTAEYIRTNRLLSPGDRVICALSGGCDSVCLLLLLTRLKEQLGLEALTALHVHHGIRGQEADRDEAFCRSLCARLAVPLVLRHENIPALAEKTGESLEEAGRRRRLEIFAEEAGKTGAVVAAAHHLNDQAETVLINLCRGSGLPGLAAMQPSRSDSRGFTLIRPLLWAERPMLEAYVRERGESWCEDSTNASGDNTRSRLRGEVLPVLEDIFPHAARHIAALAEKAGSQEAFLQALARDSLLRAENPDGSLNLPRLLEEDKVLRQKVFALWLDKNGGLKDIGESHYQALSDLAEGRSGRRIDLPGDRCVLRDQSGLHLLQKNAAGKADGGAAGDPAQDFSVRLIAAKDCGEIPKKKYTKWLDYDTITEPLCFRTRRKGDYLILEGGGRQSLQDYFVNEKIPLSRRDEVPLAASGDHILWVVGGRISAAAKITESTKTIIEIQYGGDHGKTSSGRSDQQ